MKIRIRASIFAVFFTFTVAITLTIGPFGVRRAEAQTSRPRPAQVDKRTTPVKNVVFDEGSEIEGAVLSPDGDGIVILKDPGHGSLLRLRRNFFPEIYKTTESIL